MNRVDPLGAALDNLPANELRPHRAHPAAGPMTALDQGDIAASRLQYLRGAQTSQASTDNNDSHEEVSAATECGGDL